MIRKPFLFEYRTVFFLVFLFYFFCIAYTSFSQDKPLPQWLQMEKGIKAYDEGRLGTALQIFRNIAEEDPLFANVHMWIGHVFAAEGEYLSAKEKYLDALEDSRNFFPQSEEVNAYYSLAEVSRRLEQWSEMEMYLETILNKAAVEELPVERIDAMTDKFISEGPDKLIELYRLNNKQVRKAYEQLGNLALQKKEYRRALKHLLLSITTSLSIAIDMHGSKDPEYSFIKYDMNPGIERFFTRNTETLLKESRDIAQLNEYFSAVGLYRQFYLLGMAMLGIGESEKAEEIWMLVAEYRRAGIWANLARNQIAEPSLDVLPTVLHYR